MPSARLELPAPAGFFAFGGGLVATSYTERVLSAQLAKARTEWLTAIACEDREAEAFAMKRIDYLLGHCSRATPEPSNL